MTLPYSKAEPQLILDADDDDDGHRQRSNCVRKHQQKQHPGRVGSHKRGKNKPLMSVDRHKGVPLEFRKANRTSDTDSCADVT